MDASLGRIPRCDVAGRAAGRAGHRLWSRGQMGLDRAPGAEDERGGPGRAQWPGQWAPRSLRQPSWLPAVAVTAAPQSGTGPPHQVAAVCAADPPQVCALFSLRRRRCRRPWMRRGSTRPSSSAAGEGLAGSWSAADSRAPGTRPCPRHAERTHLQRWCLHSAHALFLRARGQASRPRGGPQAGHGGDGSRRPQAGWLSGEGVGSHGAAWPWAPDAWLASVPGALRTTGTFTSCSLTRRSPRRR